MKILGLFLSNEGLGEHPAGWRDRGRLQRALSGTHHCAASFKPGRSGPPNTLAAAASRGRAWRGRRSHELMLGVLACVVLGGCVRKSFNLCDGDNPDPECPGVGDSGAGAGSGAGNGVCDDCGGETPHCLETTRECVGCLDNANCSAADASRCVENSCVACEGDEDCNHLEGLAACDAGVCRECTPAREAELCRTESDQPASCNPQTYKCTNVQLGSLVDCEKCVSDSECGEVRKCVPMKFRGDDLEDGYCQFLTSAGCQQHFIATLQDRVSLSGEDPANYCGIDENVTTCEAVLQYEAQELCTDTAACGATNLDDSRCERRAGQSALWCTYSCVDDNECPGSANCGCETAGCSNRFCGGEFN